MKRGRQARIRLTGAGRETRSEADDLIATASPDLLKLRPGPGSGHRSSNARGDSTRRVIGWAAS